ncbi:metal-dependent hydrolase [Haloparvum sp. PAK95]|uniref:metal-dependent hydrolase n=1 Tax=Haloparvum sp. PAK95 TaxID=3418962 RepID=UPI003D2EFF28
MMLPTHAVVGLALAAPLTATHPELASAALAGAFLGSVFPDVDLYAGHRRTLHFPTIYTVLAVPAAMLAIATAVPVTVALAFFAIGAAAHCRMDRWGGGLELRPWEGTSEKAVYDHVRNEWRTPKRWIPYDGAREDFLLAASVGVPLFVLLEGPFRWVVAVALLVAGTYAALRRRLADLAPVVFGYVPDRLSQYVPERYRAP